MNFVSFFAVQEADALRHQRFRRLGKFLGSHRHAVGEPAFEQADAARAHEGVVKLDLLRRGVRKAARVGLHAFFTPDLDQPLGERFVPVGPERHGTDVRVVAQAAEDLRRDAQLCEVGGLRFQKRLERRFQILHHFGLNLLEQVVNIVVMRVKRAAVDAGGVAQRLDRDALNRLLPELVGEGLADQHFRHARAVVVFLHGGAAFLKTIGELPDKTDADCWVCRLNASRGKRCRLHFCRCLYYNTDREEIQHRV